MITKNHQKNGNNRNIITNLFSMLSYNVCKNFHHIIFYSYFYVDHMYVSVIFML
jgi:hypothetical protein